MISARTLFAGLLLAGVVAESSAVAQEGETSQASESLPPVPAPPDVAWERYHEAVLELAYGRRLEAKQALEKLAADFPKHEAGEAARTVVEALVAVERGDSAPPAEESAARASGKLSEADRAVGEQPSSGARASLVAFQTLHGIALGVETCLLLDCEDARLGALSALLGASSGLGLSLLLTQRGVRSGEQLAIDSGTLWGAWNAAALSGVADLYDGGSGDVALSLIMMGQVFGTAAGAVLGRGLQPTAGDVSLVNSAGLWSLPTVGLTLVLADADLSSSGVFLALLLASDAGLLGGAVFAAHTEVSRGRVLLVDAGGLVGALGGAGFALLVGGEDVNGRFAAGATLVGMLGGLGTGFFLTRDWDEQEDADDEELDANVGLMPVPGGGLASLRIALP